jgi:hypothetical protein
MCWFRVPLMAYDTGVYWPFLIAIVVFWLAIFVSRKRGNLGTMRDLMDRHAALCRRIAAERLRLPALQGEAHAAALGRVEALDGARGKLEQRALRLRETLMKAGFAVHGAQLTTVEDAEAALKAELASKGG